MTTEDIEFNKRMAAREEARERAQKARLEKAQGLPSFKKKKVEPVRAPTEETDKWEEEINWDRYDDDVGGGAGGDGDQDESIDGSWSSPTVGSRGGSGWNENETTSLIKGRGADSRIEVRESSEFSGLPCARVRTLQDNNTEVIFFCLGKVKS